MAKARITLKENVKLTLTADEAQALADILANIAGSPELSRRGLADNISDALHRVGFRYDFDDITGSVQFHQGPVF